jgi:tyrosinase
LLSTFLMILVYPFEGNDQLVNKDRRGELFYYMHEQIIARYNFERFSNGLKRVTALDDLRIPIPQGYFPKLDSIVASRTWPGNKLKIRNLWMLIFI